MEEEQSHVWHLNTGTDFRWNYIYISKLSSSSDHLKLTCSSVLLAFNLFLGRLF